ncbi:hypothetical protein [Paenibacillus sp. M-152]|uniref:hypothetical protein n=1 Tax=Paenibacillus sp. M-152 TaxID=2487928 RepID=UPI000F701347|nr:hypothetical protein [Paenibacillus sp. M-152]AZH31304.1 hypothetical protein EGM68_22405 [Paenibacillus sp. M-152]
MIYIDMSKLNLDQSLLDEGARLTAELLVTPEKDRKQFIDDNSAYWTKLKFEFEKLSHYKCWYTEAKEDVSAYTMDHFRPKNKVTNTTHPYKIKTIASSQAYWWLAFDPQNYRLMGSTPNSKKGVRFPLREGSPIALKTNEIGNEVPVLIDPTNKDDVTWIDFNEDGKVCPACSDIESWCAIRVYLSAKIYGLDSEKLVKARKEIRTTCKRIADRIVSIYQQDNYNNNPLVREEMQEKCRELRNLANPESEYSAVAKSYILSHPESFIRKFAV